MLSGTATVAPAALFRAVAVPQSGSDPPAGAISSGSTPPLLSVLLHTVMVPSALKMMRVEPV